MYHMRTRAYENYGAFHYISIHKMAVSYLCFLDLLERGNETDWSQITTFNMQLTVEARATHWTE